MFHAIRVSRVENSVEYVDNPEKRSEYKEDFLFDPERASGTGVHLTENVEKRVENVEIEGG